MSCKYNFLVERLRCVNNMKSLKCFRSKHLRKKSGIIEYLKVVAPRGMNYFPYELNSLEKGGKNKTNSSVAVPESKNMYSFIFRRPII